MSLNVEPDYQTFIDRLALICRKSALLFPRSIGGDNTVQDLITQVITNQLPIPQLSVEGPDPPYIYDITQNQTVAKNIVVRPIVAVNLR